MDDKRYLHYYDEQGVAVCANRSSPIFSRYLTRHSIKPGVQYLVNQWQTDRLRHELFLHVLHALGMVQWVQPKA